MSKHTTKIKADRSTGLGAGVMFVANDTGRLLFLLRSPTSEMPNTWCCPGGGVEPGETVIQGLRRECLEEAGYAEPFTPIPMHTDVHASGFTFHNFWAVVPREFKPVLNDEHTAYQWTDRIPHNIHPGLLRSMLRYGRLK